MAKCRFSDCPNKCLDCKSTSSLLVRDDRNSMLSATKGECIGLVKYIYIQ